MFPYINMHMHCNFTGVKPQFVYRVFEFFMLQVTNLRFKNGFY
jgi:hypothetical protein